MGAHLGLKLSPKIMWINQRIRGLQCFTDANTFQLAECPEGLMNENIKHHLLPSTNQFGWFAPLKSSLKPYHYQTDQNDNMTYTTLNTIT